VISGWRLVNGGKQMKRKQARELLMQLLFQMNINNDYGSEIIERFKNNYQLEEQNEYFDSTLKAVLQHMQEINSLIEKSTENWKIERISKVELAVIRLSVAEILFISEIPQSVSINEAVELSKKFSGEESGKFVNGILGSIVRKIDG